MTAQHMQGKLIFGVRAWSDDYSSLKPIQKPFDYQGPGYYENPGLYAEDGTEVVGCDEYSIFSSGEDARRLVACWNACDGIYTDELERIASTGGMVGPREDVARIAAQRDELLAALQNFVKEFEGCYADGEPAMIAARAAIQKATNKEQA